MRNGDRDTMASPLVTPKISRRPPRSRERKQASIAAGTATYSAKAPFTVSPIAFQFAHRFPRPLRHARQWPQNSDGSTATLSPSRQSSGTPSPCATTRPANSWPGMIGYGVGGNSPSAMCTSVPQMPQAPTWITSSPWPGAGSAASVTSSFPGASQITARIMSPHGCRSRRQCRAVADGSVPDPQAAGRVEQVKMGGVGGHLDDLAGPGMLTAGPDDDAARRVVGQVAVDIGVAAEIFDQRDLHGHLAVTDRQVLGPDPGDQLAVALGGGKLRVGGPEQDAAHPDAAALRLGVEP